jgi:hypothetical protein
MAGSTGKFYCRLAIERLTIVDEWAMSRLPIQSGDRQSAIESAIDNWQSPNSHPIVNHPIVN